MSTVVLCDFDGTITTFDTCVTILDKFSDGNWEKYDDHLLEGKISLEECMQSQFLMVKASKKEILKELQESVIIRNGFKEFVRFCRGEGIPFLIVSGGLDFLIQYFLESLGLQDYVEVVAARTRFGDKGMELEFPFMRFGDSLDFKADLVRYYKENGFKVVYIGDGLSDFEAVIEADHVFVVNGSMLLDRCRDIGIECIEFTSFIEVKDKLENVLSEIN
ncbi:MtnX-like HAD-IB family phosphatase [Thermoproteota archaeon]